MEGEESDVGVVGIEEPALCLWMQVPRELLLRHTRLLPTTRNYEFVKAGDALACPVFVLLSTIKIAVMIR
ncbi:hypothetical protein Y032_0038g3610 [Ancylostoma ceylanicum]|uniref:Uncharacterized protein n=1 Tax=Ancylostoma ceylanicum TaxID=53326 RepID=A0A016UJS0_9BILA|nr:hypothetical protein Y032_0038g3610 [Ancylostoma ceylanicum]